MCDLGINRTATSAQVKTAEFRAQAMINGFAHDLRVQVTGADIYVLYSKSWLVQNNKKQISKNNNLKTKSFMFFFL